MGLQLDFCDASKIPCACFVSCEPLLGGRDLLCILPTGLWFPSIDRGRDGFEMKAVQASLGSSDLVIDQQPGCSLIRAVPLAQERRKE